MQSKKKVCANFFQPAQTFLLLCYRIYFHFYICLNILARVVYCICDHCFTIIYKNTDLIRVYIYFKLKSFF